MKKTIAALSFILLLPLTINIANASEKAPAALDKEWYCNIVKGNAVKNYFNLPAVDKGLDIKRDDYETSADYDEAVEYYNLENYRITLDFTSMSKATLGYTNLLYSNEYKDSQNVKKTYSYKLNNNTGTLSNDKENYQFILNGNTLAFPTQNIICYQDITEAQKNYNLYELNENFDKTIADENGFVVKNNILTKYIGNKRKIILPATATSIANFEGTNIYYFSSFIIPGNIKKIENEALEYLKTDDLIILEGVEEIGTNAFNTSNLTDIYLPSSLKVLKDKIFGSEITDNPTFHLVKNSIIDNYLKNNYAANTYNVEYDYEEAKALIEDTENYVQYSYKEIKSFFNKDGFAIKNNILYGYNKNSNEVVLPSNITTIATDAFSDYYNSKIKKVIVPKNVKTIEYNSFAFTNANTIVFDEGLEKIESYAFSDAYLTDIYLPSSITKIGKNIFETEEGLKGAVFHVVKDSPIAKYLQQNPPYGDFTIEYDYEKAQDLINANPTLKKIKIITFIAILGLISAIIILIVNYKKVKKVQKNIKLTEKRYEHKLRNILSAEESSKVDANSVITNETSMSKMSNTNENREVKVTNEPFNQVKGQNVNNSFTKEIHVTDQKGPNQLTISSENKEVNNVDKKFTKEEPRKEKELNQFTTPNENKEVDNVNKEFTKEESKEEVINNQFASANEDKKSPGLTINDYSKQSINTNIEFSPLYNPNITTIDKISGEQTEKENISEEQIVTQSEIENPKTEIQIDSELI